MNIAGHVWARFKRSIKPSFFSGDSIMFLLFKKLEIAHSVIVSNAVKMVDNLALFEIAPNMFFHHKAVLHDVFFIHTKRMSGFIDKNIPVGIASPASPIRGLNAFSFLSKIGKNLSMFFRQRAVFSAEICLVAFLELHRLKSIT